jgi:uncharacterized protein (DUF302 family)
VDLAVAAITERGMAVFARIDHAGAAAKAGQDLRPTEVILFGNPRAGTPLMRATPTIGIDLPLKILVWQDETGKTWLAYNDPTWLVERHHAGGGTREILSAMTAALTAVARRATAPKG